MKRILFLDDIRDPEVVLGPLWKKNDVTIVRSFEEAIKAVSSQEAFDVWTLDHDLGQEILGAEGQIISVYGKPVEERAQTGFDFVKWAATNAGDKWPADIRVHSANPVGKRNMEAFIASYRRFYRETNGTVQE